MTRPADPDPDPADGTPARGPRLALGLVRLAFGSVALLRPETLVRRVDGVGDTSPAAVYAFRMFGIRTVLIGVQLLGRDGPVRRATVATAPAIHGSDTLTAALLTVQGKVPGRTGAPLVAVSALNTVLAVRAVLASRRTPL
jgi:hypothetical protein